VDTEGARAGTPAEGNRAVVMRYIEEVWNRHDLGAIDGLVSPGYVNHAAGTEEYRHGGARLIWEWERVAAQQSHWFRVVDGKLAEHWAVRDDLGMLRQLGVVPP
jgi:predicted SnoaL-like aldol condensation-catalyzing enzyme